MLLCYICLKDRQIIDWSGLLFFICKDVSIEDQERRGMICFSRYSQDGFFFFSFQVTFGQTWRHVVWQTCDDYSYLVGWPWDVCREMTNGNWYPAAIKKMNILCGRSGVTSVESFLLKLWKPWSQGQNQCPVVQVIKSRSDDIKSQGQTAMKSRSDNPNVQVISPKVKVR